MAVLFVSAPVAPPVVLPDAFADPEPPAFVVPVEAEPPALVDSEAPSFRALFVDEGSVSESAALDLRLREAPLAPKWTLAFPFPFLGEALDGAMEM